MPLIRLSMHTHNQILRAINQIKKKNALGRLNGVDGCFFLFVLLFVCFFNQQKRLHAILIVCLFFSVVIIV